MANSDSLPYINSSPVVPVPMPGGVGEFLYMCLVCGFQGCAQHSRAHFTQSGHSYALELATQRVYDFQQRGYVQELLYNADGNRVGLLDQLIDDDAFVGENMMEDGENMLSGRRIHSGRRDSGLHRSCGLEQDVVDSNSPKSKQQGQKKGKSKSTNIKEHGTKRNRSERGDNGESQNVIREFNELLAQQLSEQRAYYEELLSDRETSFNLKKSEYLKKVEIEIEQKTDSITRLEQAEKNFALAKTKLEEYREKGEKYRKERIRLMEEVEVLEGKRGLDGDNPLGSSGGAGGSSTNIGSSRSSGPSNASGGPGPSPSGGKSQSHINGGGVAPVNAPVKQYKSLNKKEKKLQEKNLIKQLRAEIQELKMNLQMKNKFKKNDVSDVLFTS